MIGDLSNYQVVVLFTHDPFPEGVSRIITMKGTKGMPLFEDVYKICTAPDATYSQRLYYKLKEFLENHVEKLKTVRTYSPRIHSQFIDLTSYFFRSC